MRKNICFLVSFVMVMQCFALGSLEGRDAMKNHPEVISYESRAQEHGEYHEVTLTGGRKIEFDTINGHSGGGFYAAVTKIGEYTLYDSAFYLTKTKKWKNAGGSGAFFIDLSQILGIKIETMIDVIDNYDKILELAKFLALEQFKAGYYESTKLTDNRRFDLQTINEFPLNYVISENRKAVIYVSSIYEYPRWVWDGIQEDELKHCDSFNYRFGDGWENNVPYDKIRKSLGLE